MMKKRISLLLVVVMILTLMIPSFVFGAVKDYTGHWAEDTIQKWLDKSYISGYPDGSFKPDGKVTRAEFVTMVNKLFDYTETSEINFSDVKSSDWYYKEVQKAFKAGYISGISETQFAPNDNLTREQAAVIVSRIMKLEGDGTAAKTFTDNSKISGWALNLVGAAAKAEIVKGYAEDNSFRPQNSITRAEAVVTLDRTQKQEPTDLTIDKPGTVLENVTVENIHITKEVGNGNVILKNVTVTGELLVEGGGENSIVIEDSDINTVIVDKADGKIRILVKGESIIEFTSILSGVILEQQNLTGKGFIDVIVSNEANEKQTVTIKSDIENFAIRASVKINVKSGIISELTVDESAEDLKISLSKDVKVLLAIVNAKASFTGSGTIEKAKINKNGVTFSKMPAEVEVAKGVNNPKTASTKSNGGSNNTPSIEDKIYDQAGTYGPATGTETVNDVVVSAADITLQNIHIKGDLELAEGIGEGDVTLKNVIVDGTTVVRGGGANSIHFVDTVLATVIVNKNNGSIRIVVEGASEVIEVQLESPAILQESNLSGSANGFNNVTVTESVQTGDSLQVELIGQFETINSRGTNVRIQLDESTSVQDLVLNALARVLGLGTINTATINANGSSLSSRPANMVLNVSSVSLRDELGNEETITESYSNAERAEIEGINLNMNSIKVEMDNFVAGLTIRDFDISATLDGEEITLQNTEYNVNQRRITFTPVPLTDNVGKTLKVTVAPASDSDKLTGEAQSNEVTVQYGFTGRITDIQEVGLSGATIKFRAGSNNRDGDIAATVTTDQYGYYTVYLPAGQYTGEISGSGLITTYMYAASLSDVFNIAQNETAIRATGMDSVKIVLTWGEEPRDEDSHLEGPTSDGRFHTWYADRIYEENGIRFADLDWDDTSSYGPETTTIYRLVDGTYRFFVHNYSSRYDDSILASSGAKVEVYIGRNSQPATFVIPTDGSIDDIYWLVFDMEVTDGEVEIIERNELLESLLIKKSATAEDEYKINGNDDFSYSDDYDSITNGYITGVPVGTVADLKSDIVAVDADSIIKVVDWETDIYSIETFDSAVELPSNTALEDGQILAIKTAYGRIATYVIKSPQTLEQAKIAVGNALNNLTVFNYTTADYIHYAIGYAIYNDAIELEITQFEMTAATVGMDGSIAITVKLTLNGETETISVNKVIAALPQDESYTVTFENEGDIFTTKTTVDGYVSLPSEPTKDGFNFAGWFLEDGTTEFTEDTLVELDITVYAKWLEDNTTPETPVNYVEIEGLKEETLTFELSTTTSTAITANNTGAAITVKVVSTSGTAITISANNTSGSAITTTSSAIGGEVVLEIPSEQVNSVSTIEITLTTGMETKKYYFNITR